MDTPDSDTRPVSGSIEDELRLAVLKSTALLDSGPEAAFDRFTRLASALVSAPVSLVSLVDRDRQYFKSHFGLGEPWASRRETPLSHSFCQHVVERREPLVIGDARKEPLVCDNLAVSELDVQAYLGIPLVTREGQVLGSFCAIDNEPREWSDEQVALMQDLAVSVMTEIEFRMVSSRFIENFREMMALDQERDETVQMLVHDLRNPLSSLLAGLDMVEMIDGLGERHRKYLQRAREGGHSLLDMVNEILTVSRGDAGELALVLEPVEPHRMVAAAVARVAELAMVSKVSLDDRVPRSLPPVTADAGRLERVLVNLISNALDHTPADGRVELSARELPEQDLVEFSVSDTGSGIPAAEQDRVFEKFYQVGQVDRGKGNRSGLGLPFCKTVVEAHGGRIKVDSAPGRGTRLFFTIPYGMR